MPTNPLAAKAPKLPQAQAPTIPARPGPKAPTAATPRGGPAAADNRVAKAATGVGRLAQVDLDAVASAIDKIVPTADDASVVIEGERLMRGDSTVGKIGKIGAVVATAAYARQLTQAFTQSPVDMDKAVYALSGIAVNIGEFEGLIKGLGVVGGAANVLQGALDTIKEIKSLKENGANASDIIWMVESVSQALGGAFQLAAIAAAATFPPAAPILEGISVGLYLLCGAATIAAMAYDNREWLASKAEGAWNFIKHGVESLAPHAAPATPSRAGP